MNEFIRSKILEYMYSPDVKGLNRDPRWPIPRMAAAGCLARSVSESDKRDKHEEGLCLRCLEYS